MRCESYVGLLSVSNCYFQNQRTKCLPKQNCGEVIFQIFMMTEYLQLEHVILPINSIACCKFSQNSFSRNVIVMF